MVSRLANSLDGMMAEFKREALQDFVAAERALTQQHRNTLEARQLDWEKKRNEFQARIHALEATGSDLSRRSETQQRQMKRLGVLSRRVLQEKTGRLALERGWEIWKEALRSRSEEQIRSRMASKLRERRLNTLALSQWRRRVQRDAEQRREEKARLSAELARAQLVTEANFERDKLAKQVEQLSQRLEQETRSKVHLQENLKRVFMRGVCALNFEAMSLLSNPEAGGYLAPSPLVSAAPWEETSCLVGDEKSFQSVT